MLFRSRRAQARKVQVSDDDLSSLSEVYSDSDEALSLKGKGKGKASSKKGKASASTDSKVMTFSELRAERRKEAAARRKEKRASKAEERELAKKLGRKLTHAEKTTLALHKNHPELQGVWGDLETRVKPVTPLKAEQPDELKIDLLPFQLESLYWMREQEKGEWHGGMLAVSDVYCIRYAWILMLMHAG